MSQLTEKESEGDFLTDEELKEYDREFDLRAFSYGLRIMQVPDGNEYSGEWIKDVGSFWKENRTQLGVSRRKMAEEVGTSVGMIRFLELGFIEDRELNPTFLRSCARALGKPRLYGQFRKRFGIPKQP